MSNRLVLSLILFIGLQAGIASARQTEPKVLTNQDIIKMQRDGTDNLLIWAAIKENYANYDLSNEKIKELEKLKIPRSTIMRMQNANKYNPAPSGSPSKIDSPDRKADTTVRQGREPNWLENIYLRKYKHSPEAFALQYDFNLERDDLYAIGDITEDPFNEHWKSMFKKYNLITFNVEHQTGVVGTASGWRIFVHQFVTQKEGSRAESFYIAIFVTPRGTRTAEIVFDGPASRRGPIFTNQNEVLEFVQNM